MPNQWWSTALWAWSSGMHNPASLKQIYYFTKKGLSSQTYGFSSSHIWMLELGYFKKAECRRTNTFEIGVREDSWESLGLQGDPIQRIDSHPKGNQSCIFIGGTDAEVETPILLATWCEEPTHRNRPWCWERLRAGGEWDDRGWDGWMASLTWWTWVWVNSGSWWWIGRCAAVNGVPKSQTRLSDWTELNWKPIQPYFLLMTRSL